MACQGCGSRRAAPSFGVRSYLDHFYQGCRSEPDEETLLRPGGPTRGPPGAARGSTACKAWFACGLLGMLAGAAVMLAAYLTPARVEAVGNGGRGGVSDVLLVDRSAARFNGVLEACKLAGALIFAVGGAGLSGSLLAAAAAARDYRAHGDADAGDDEVTVVVEEEEEEAVVQENRLLLHEVRPSASGAVPKSGRRLWK